MSFTLQYVKMNIDALVKITGFLQTTIKELVAPSEISISLVWFLFLNNLIKENEKVKERYIFSVVIYCNLIIINIITVI